MKTIFVKSTVRPYLPKRNYSAWANYIRKQVEKLKTKSN